MDYQALAELLFPDVNDTPESLEARFPQRDLPEGAVVTRMAPSPTGFVHLGNLVQGLTSERMAHQSGGCSCGWRTPMPNGRFPVLWRFSSIP